MNAGQHKSSVVALGGARGAGGARIERQGGKGSKWGKGGKYFLWPDVMTVENRVEATVVLVIRINLNYSQLIKTS